MKIRDVLIIGSGPAGMNAAIYARHANLDVLILEKNVPGGAMATTAKIENYISYETINGADLSIKMYDHAIDSGADYDYGDVESIKKAKDHFIVKTDVDEIFAKKIIIATGTVSRVYDAKNSEMFMNKSISFCAICDGSFYVNQDVVVLGGANSAVEESIYLANICNTVTIITRSNFKANKSAISKMEKTNNINQIQNANVLEFVEKDGKLAGVKYLDKTTDLEQIVECTGIFEFIGSIPSTDFVDCEKERGYIVTDEYCQTSIDGIYAAGDCIKKNLRQIATAISDGAIAAISVAKSLN